MKHDRTRFVERLDYLTSPGWLEGNLSREQAGLKRGGVTAVITNKCVIRFNEDNKDMFVSEYFQGCEPKAIREDTGFDLDISQAKEMKCPSIEELRILRNEVDPDRLII